MNSYGGWRRNPARLRCGGGADTQQSRMNLEIGIAQRTHFGTVEAFDLDEWLGYQPHLKVSLDKSSGSNGDTLNLTIQVLSKNTDYGGESFVLSHPLV